ncbi:MAG: hypothetical protein FWG89_01225 [Treponema sp.]|nr:hypothetical protein [Treponema sp.]
MAMVKSKKDCAWHIVLAALLIAVVCIGCAEEQGSFEMDNYPHELGRFKGLSADTEWRILQDCYRQYIQPNQELYMQSINDLEIIQHGGNYNGSVVVTLLGRWPQVTEYPPSNTIRDEIFNIYSLAPLVWNDGIFYTAREAYDSALLKKEDLQTIAGLLEIDDTIDLDDLY